MRREARLGSWKWLNGALALVMMAGPAPAEDRKILFLAGRDSHGWGTHQHYGGTMVLASGMKNSSLPVEVQISTGQFFCLDPVTGEVRWTGPPRTGENVMLLSIPGYVLALIDNGELQVIEASGERYQPVRRYRVADGGSWAPPVVFPDGFLVKDAAHLTRWDLDVP